MIWTCAVTGRSNLTFEEAQQSEKAAQATLDEFPTTLERPLLYLANLTYRGRIDDVVVYYSYFVNYLNY
jgi:bromodomain adjacent to zinc finger domain protein 1A